jgi:HAD superfamily hydrolase (TIGR01450 family)
VDGGTAVAYVTNNASRRAGEVAELLASIGVPARAEEVLTSARAAAELLAADLPPASPVLVVGAPALREEIVAVGLRPVDDPDDRPAAVVQGYGPDVGWAQLADATLAVRAGARWVATNTDVTLPSLRGPLPGNGSLVAAVSAALGGRKPDTVVGKPQPALFELAARHAGARRVLVVGDRLDTDIDGARRAGMDALLVLTGVTGAAEVLRAGVHERPTHIGADCTALSTADDAARVPAWWDGQAAAGPWRVTYDDRRLVLSTRDSDADGDAVAAVRALAAGAWAHPEWTGVAAADPDADRALAALGLDRFGSWPVSASH